MPSVAGNASVRPPGMPRAGPERVGIEANFVGLGKLRRVITERDAVDTNAVRFTLQDSAVHLSHAQHCTIDRADDAERCRRYRTSRIAKQQVQRYEQQTGRQCEYEIQVTQCG